MLNREKTGIAIVAAGIAALTFAPGAGAAVDFTGVTDQGNDIRIQVDEDGAAERVAYGWDMSCTGDATLTGGGTISQPKRSNPTGFRSRGGYSAPIEKKYQGEFKVRLKGERVNENRYRGSFKVKVKVFEEKSGDLLTKCSTGIVRWTADLKNSGPKQPQSSTAGRLSLR
jgi:hypothetical protein